MRLEMVDLDYYRRRAEEEQAAADAATNPYVRRVHLDMAQKYRMLAGDAAAEPHRPPLPAG